MPDASRYSIAVVDDDFRMLQSLESLLESAGHWVRVFDSAEAFLNSGMLDEIDCLISDIRMPGMDGLELLRLAQTGRPELPVFLITGRDEVTRPQHSPSLSANRFFRKPFDGKELLREVADALRAAGG